MVFKEKQLEQLKNNLQAEVPSKITKESKNNK
jgi:hypothetical protein